MVEILKHRAAHGLEPGKPHARLVAQRNMGRNHQIEWPRQHASGVAHQQVIGNRMANGLHSSPL